MIQLYIEGKIAEGKVADLRAAVETLAKATASHDGVDSYQFYVDADETTFIGLERYRDAAALGGHAAALGEDGLNALMAALDGPPAMTVCGELPPELVAVFQGMGARFVTSIGGFTK